MLVTELDQYFYAMMQTVDKVRHVNVLIIVNVFQKKRKKNNLRPGKKWTVSQVLQVQFEYRKKQLPCTNVICLT